MFDDISFLLSTSKVLFTLAIVFLILAIILFFLLDIKNVLQIETGSARRKTVQEMHERNQRTGTLRHVAENSGGKTKENADHREKAGKRADTQKHDGRPSKTEKTSVGATHKSGSNAGTEGFTDGSDGAAPRQQSLAETGILKEGLRAVGFEFTVTQKTIIVHTDEIIPA